VRLGVLLPGWAWSAAPSLDGLGHETPSLVERPRPSYTNKWRDRPKKYSKSVNEDVASNTAYSEKTGPILLPLEPLRPVAWLRSRQDLATAPNGPGPCTPASDIIHQDRNRPGVDPAAWAAGDPTPAEESWTASYTRLTAPRCAAIRCA
jgi:hypothetical protein